MAAAKAKDQQGQQFSLETTLAAVLSHPIRVRCFVALSEQPASAAQLERAFGQEVDYHLRKLKALGLIEEVGSRRVRGHLERFYRSCVKPIIETAAWAMLPFEERDAFSRYVLQLHVTDLALAVDEGVFDSRTNRWLIRMPMELDEEGFEEMAEEEQRTFDRRNEIQARARERLAERRRGGEDPTTIPAVSSTMFHEAARGSGELGRVD